MHEAGTLTGRHGQEPQQHAHGAVVALKERTGDGHVGLQRQASKQPPQQQQQQTADPTRKAVIRKGVKDFEFGATLGEGSYSTVVSASDRQTLKEYAIKVLDKRHIIKERKTEYVHVEKNTLNRLSGHPGIVQLYYTFQDVNSLYFVLDYAANGELLSLIKRMGSLNEECTKYYGAQILSTVEYMHAHGVIHRDLKPENILLDYKMRVKITDFGTAKLMDAIGKTSDGKDVYPKDVRASSFVGTAEYVSPELLTQKATGKGADLWAFGCVIFQLIAGHVPFQAVNEYQMFQKIIGLKYSFPDTYPAVPRDLVKRLLVLKPERRYTLEQVKAHEFFADTIWDTETLWSQPPPKLQPYRPPTSVIKKAISAKTAASRSNKAGSTGGGGVKASQAAAIALGGVFTRPQPTAKSVMAAAAASNSSHNNNNNMSTGVTAPPQHQARVPQIKAAQQQAAKQGHVSYHSQTVKPANKPVHKATTTTDTGSQRSPVLPAQSQGTTEQPQLHTQSKRQVASLRPMFRQTPSNMSLRSRSSQSSVPSYSQTTPNFSRASSNSSFKSYHAGHNAIELPPTSSLDVEWGSLLGSPEERVLKVASVMMAHGPPPASSMTRSDTSESGTHEENNSNSNSNSHSNSHSNSNSTSNNDERRKEREVSKEREQVTSRFTRLFSSTPKKKRRFLLVTSAARMLIAGEDRRLRTELQISSNNPIIREYPYNEKASVSVFVVAYNNKSLTFEDASGPNAPAEWIEAVEKSKEMYYKSSQLSSSNAAHAATAAALAVGGASRR